MKLLRDSELYELITGPNPIIEKVNGPEDGNWFGFNSPVQPSSIDLHIGHILLPEQKQGTPGSAENPLYGHILGVGHTAVIRTREHFALPGNLAGIGFPPDSVSSQGILMTNPGHIDPGYKGQMRFTLINMGRKEYALRGGDPIVTVLLFELDAHVKQDYGIRHDLAQHLEPKDPLDRLSEDFLDVEKRAATIATREVGRAGLVAAAIPTVISGCIALITALAIGFFSPSWKDPLNDVKKDIAVLQSKADPNQLKTDVSVLQSRADPNQLKADMSALQVQTKADMEELRNQIKKIQDELAGLRPRPGVSGPSSRQSTGTATVN